MMEYTFSYQYSAKENAEIKAIRDRYLPQNESKLDQLRRLDNKVQSAGSIEAISVGIIGALMLGLGLCLSMQVIGSGLLMLLLGCFLGLAGITAMGAAYPVYRKVFESTKEKYAPQILALASEITGEK